MTAPPRDYGRERYRRHIARRDRVQDAMRGVYQYTRLGARTWGAELDMRQHVRDSKDYVRLRAIDREWLAGWDSAQREYQLTQLEWRVWYRGALVPSAAVLPGTWNEVIAGAYVWKHQPDKIYDWPADLHAHVYPAVAFPALEMESAT